MKKGFILYVDSLEILKDLSSTDAGELFKAIYYHHIGDEYDLEPHLKLLFIQFRNQFIRDGEKYNETISKRSMAGKAGANKRWQMLSHDNKSQQVMAKIADKDKVTDKVKDKDIHIPTYDEFLQYATQQVPTINKEDVRLKYEAWKVNGWADGNDKKIKNWKSKLTQTLPYLRKDEKSTYVSPIIHE